jgi:acetyltransferase-like isoleucine patch superfamily enzyme/acyl carrier protein
VATESRKSREQLDEGDFIRHQLHSGSESSMTRYSKLVLAKPNLLSILKYEFICMWMPLPGALGLALRRLLVKRLLASCGSGSIFGRSITLRHPDNIHVGRSAVLDDYCLVDARGAGAEGIVLGDRVMVNRGASIQAKVGTISIGEGTGVGAYSQIISQGPIHISENVSIAAMSMIAGGRYDVDIAPDAPNAKTRFTDGPIVIESNVRIGMRSTILDGVHIGRNSIIAPGSVVFDDVPPDTVVMGCPARPLRQRTIRSSERVQKSTQVDAHKDDDRRNNKRSSNVPNDIKLVIQDYLEETHYASFSDGQLGLDDSLFDHNVIDSVGLVGIITMLEDRFNIELDADDLVPENLSTVRGLIGIVENKR